MKFLTFFGDFGPLEAHFGINFGPQEPFGRHLEYESKKGRPKGPKTICPMILLGLRGGELGSILDTFLEHFLKHFLALNFGSFWMPFWRHFGSFFEAFF